jgi:hypothetical protein
MARRQKEREMATASPMAGAYPDEIAEAFTLLKAGIPLTLLLDLATPIRSVDVYRTEPGAADWLLAASVA